MSAPVKRPRAGRPPAPAGARASSLTLRLSTAERAAWEAAAARYGAAQGHPVSLAEYVRVCMAVARTR